MERANKHGGCEFCITPNPNIHLTWHHVFGRGHIIPEPWASYYPLTLMLCFDHHRAADEQDLIRRAMEWMVIDEFLSHIDYDRSIKVTDFAPIELIRTVVRDLVKQGAVPPGYKEN